MTYSVELNVSHYTHTARSTHPTPHIILYKLVSLPPSLLSGQVSEVRERVQAVLESAADSIRAGSLQGQKALWKQLSDNK